MHILLGVALPQTPVLRVTPRVGGTPENSDHWSFEAVLTYRAPAPGFTRAPRQLVCSRRAGARLPGPHWAGRLQQGQVLRVRALRPVGGGSHAREGLQPSTQAGSTASVSCESSLGSPGLLAMAGTWAAKGVFTSQREVLLERPCWLDGGCEQVRRGYLYGQLCCVGGCGRSGWWAGLELVLGCYLAQVLPRPQAPETPGEEGRVVLLRDRLSSGEGGW